MLHDILICGSNFYCWQPKTLETWLNGWIWLILWVVLYLLATLNGAEVMGFTEEQTPMFKHWGEIGNELRKISPSSPMFAALFPFVFDCIAPFHGGNSLNLINPSFQNAEQSYQGLSKFMPWKVQWGWQVPQKHYN